MKAAAVAMKVGGAQLLWDLSNCPRDSSYADKETYSEATAVRSCMFPLATALHRLAEDL